MSTEIGPVWVRTDQDGFNALVSGTGDPAAVEVVQDALAAIADPGIVITLKAAGPEVRLVHRIWVGQYALGLLLALDEGRWQLMPEDPEALAAVLFRVTRTEPVGEPVQEEQDFPESLLDDLVAPDPAVRRSALDRADAGAAWVLSVDNGQVLVDVRATQGETGTRLYDPELGGFQTVGNTDLYRIFATIIDEFLLPAP